MIHCHPYVVTIIWIWEKGDRTHYTCHSQRYLHPLEVLESRGKCFAIMPLLTHVRRPLAQPVAQKLFQNGYRERRPSKSHCCKIPMVHPISQYQTTYCSCRTLFIYINCCAIFIKPCTPPLPPNPLALIPECDLPPPIMFSNPLGSLIPNFARIPASAPPVSSGNNIINNFTGCLRA